MKKKLVILMAAVLMLTSMPLYAFAEDGTAAATDESAAETLVSSWNDTHTQYFDKNGEPLKSVVKKIDGTLCYFNEDGLYDTTKGWKKTSDGSKYYIKKKQIVTGPTKITGTQKIKRNVKYYYNKKTKKWQTKAIKGAKTKIGIKITTQPKKNIYNFRANGKLITTKGIYKYKNKEYYGTKGGVLKTGWVVDGDKAMYFNPKDSKSGTIGSMAKNTKVGYLKIPKSGRLGEAYALGIKQLNKMGWSLSEAYKFSYKIRYQGRWYRAKDAETYAIKGFTQGKGNCYVMASTFYIMAKLLGYNIHQVEGKVFYTHPHSWTVIKQGGKWWVYDPNFRNETGRNGWKIWYGKKGTWRYTGYHNMN